MKALLTALPKHVKVGNNSGGSSNNNNANKNNNNNNSKNNKNKDKNNDGQARDLSSSNADSNNNNAKNTTNNNNSDDVTTLLAGLDPALVQLVYEKLYVEMIEAIDGYVSQFSSVLFYVGLSFIYVISYCTCSCSVFCRYYCCLLKESPLLHRLFMTFANGVLPTYLCTLLVDRHVASIYVIILFFVVFNKN